MSDLVVVTQDPRFGGGARAQAEAFARGARELGREPTLVHPRFVPGVDSLVQELEARRLAGVVRSARSAWVVAAAAPYGGAAVRSGRPFAAWLGTSLDDEWESRKRRLGRARRIALELNAPLLRRTEQDVLRAARRVYATSPAARTALAAAGELDGGAVGVLPIPVDTDVFAPLPDPEWLAGLERPTVMFTGRGDDPRKNLGLLLAAWSHVRSALPHAVLRLVGRPPAVALPPGVELAGEVPSVAAELRRASLFVLPSLQEGFGIVVAEALAAGVPAIVTPSGGPEELVRESGGGTVLDAFDAGELAGAIVAALHDRQALRLRRERGRAYVVAHHSPAAFCTALAAAFAELDDA